MIKLEPQEDLDKFIIGKVKNKNGVLVYAYAIEKMLEYMKIQCMKNDTQLSEQDAYLEALQDFEFNYQFAHFEGCPVYIYTEED